MPGILNERNLGWKLTRRKAFDVGRSIKLTVLGMMPRQKAWGGGS